ncbi:DUF2249 domain-containing protein [Massilia sp. TWR1-2-2]|uniref:DUF2249 domain-containing protein n=1 Tax=Massilia sp. TWR1-2-2 TaxID=2804584 RepID=UPI003CEFE5F7
MPQPTNPTEVFLDLRGLYPPEPMERVLDALADLLAGQQIRMLIEREPHPLYRILETNNYRYSSTEPEPGLYQIVIQER